MKIKSSATPRATPKSTKAAPSSHAQRSRANKLLESLRPAAETAGPSTWALRQAANDLAHGWNVTDWGNGMVTSKGLGFSGDTAVPDDRYMTRAQFLLERARSFDDSARHSLNELESHGYR